MSGGSSFLLHEDYYDILVLKKSYENFLSFHSKLGNFLNFSLSYSIASFPTTSLSRPPSPGPDAPRELCCSWVLVCLRTWLSFGPAAVLISKG